MKRILTCPVWLAGLALLTGAADDKAETLGYTGQGFVLPQRSSADQTYAKGATIFEAPLLWQRVAFLASDIFLDAGE